MSKFRQTSTRQIIEGTANRFGDVTLADGTVVDFFDVDQTTDGVPVTEGLRVFNNNLELGTVTELRTDGWHTMKSDCGGRGDFNGERLVTRHPFTREVAK